MIKFLSILLLTFGMVSYVLPCSNGEGISFFYDSKINGMLTDLSPVSPLDFLHSKYKSKQLKKTENLNLKVGEHTTINFKGDLCKESHSCILSVYVISSFIYQDYQNSIKPRENYYTAKISSLDLKKYPILSYTFNPVKPITGKFAILAVLALKKDNMESYLYNYGSDDFHCGQARYVSESYNAGYLNYCSIHLGGGGYYSDPGATDIERAFCMGYNFYNFDLPR